MRSHRERVGVQAKVLQIYRMYAVLISSTRQNLILNTAVVVCNGADKCVFVRVVDSCAGCAEGSSHVDLTKAAFGCLADLDAGILQVQMRPATEPSRW
jgi:hypothetical protein